MFYFQNEQEKSTEIQIETNIQHDKECAIGCFAPMPPSVQRVIVFTVNERYSKGNSFISLYIEGEITREARIVGSTVDCVTFSRQEGINYLPISEIFCLLWYEALCEGRSKYTWYANHITVFSVSITLLD